MVLAFVALIVFILAILATIVVVARTVRAQAESAEERLADMMNVNSQQMRELVSQQTTVMAQLVENLAQLMVHQLNTPASPDTTIATELNESDDPFMDMKRAGYDPNNPDSIAEWNELNAIRS